MGFIKKKDLILHELSLCCAIEQTYTTSLLS